MLMTASSAMGSVHQEVSADAHEEKENERHVAEYVGPVLEEEKRCRRREEDDEGDRDPSAVARGTRSGGRFHSSAFFRNCALMATITVLADMNTAPSAGVSRMPHDARTPAARGMAKML